MDAPNRPVIEVEEYAWPANREMRSIPPSVVRGVEHVSRGLSIASVSSRRRWIAACAAVFVVLMCAGIFVLARPRNAVDAPVSVQTPVPVQAPVSVPEPQPVVEATPQEAAVHAPKARLEEGKPAIGDRMVRGESSVEEESAADGAVAPEAQQSPGKHARSHR